MKNIFKNENMKLQLKTYIRSGQLPYLLISTLLNGRDKTSLELSRLGVQQRIKKKLKRKYNTIIAKPIIELPGERSNKVWIFWWQGLSEAPAIVKICYKSVIRNLKDKDVIFLDKDNVFEYINLPEFIISKWKQGKISYAHFSDILRTELLIVYGGTWIDSTVYFSGNDFPNAFFDSDLFVFQKLKPGSDGNASKISNWFITARKNEPVLMRIRELLFNYWEENNRAIDYFIYHIFFQLVLDKHSCYQKEIFKYSNSMPHILLLNLSEKYEKDYFSQLFDIVQIHKLTYKINDDIKNDSENIYNHLIGGINEK